jgi:hypothetical protein
MPTKSDHPPPHPKLTNSKKDNKKHPPPPVLITDRDVGVQYVREDDERRAFLGEVSWRSCGSLVGSGVGLGDGGWFKRLIGLSRYDIKILTFTIKLTGRIRQSILIHPTPLQPQTQTQPRFSFSFFLQNKLRNKEGTDGTDGIGNGRDHQEPRTTIEHFSGGQGCSA